MSIQSSLTSIFSAAGVLGSMLGKSKSNTNPTTPVTQEPAPAEGSFAKPQSQDVQNVPEIKPTNEQKASEAARDSLIKRQDNARKTRRSFISYMGDEDLPGGKKIGELDADVQRKIASLYGKNARQKIMNRRDADGH